MPHPSYPLDDLHERRHDEAARSFLAAIVESSDDAIIGKDMNGIITSWNRGAEHIYGYTAQEVLGQPVSMLMPPETRDDFEQIMSRLQRGESIRHYETLRRTKEGRLITVSLTVSPVRDSSGTLIGASAVARDVTERARNHEAQRQLAAIVESSDDAIIGNDLRGRITSWNQGAQRLYGYSAAEVLGQPVSLLLPPGRMDDLPELMRRLQEGQTIHHHETVRRTKDGRLLTVLLSASLIRNAGRVVGAAAIVRDITRQKQEEAVREQLKEMEWESQRVREASRMKSEFLANMSHELRTPLNGIIGFTEFLADQKPGALNPKQREYLGDILESAQHLLGLINDILDLSKVEAGRMEFRAEVFSLAQKLEEVSRIVLPLAEKKGLHFHSQLRLDPPTVQLDPQRFKQVLYNLLSNAVKFTNPGGSIEVLVRPKGSAAFEVSVRDTGIGIGAPEQGKLFLEFYQIDTTLSRAHGGTGLGLALCKRIVELQGGSISVESLPAQGSTFKVTLPRQFPATETKD